MLMGWSEKSSAHPPLLSLLPQAQAPLRALGLDKHPSVEPTVGVKRTAQRGTSQV